MIIEYTEEEIKDFISKLRFFKRNQNDGVLFINSEDILKGIHGQAYTFIEYSTQYSYVFADTLMGVLKKPITIENLEDLCNRVREGMPLSEIIVLAKIIRATDLDDVPLYINDFPEIVSWRLRIGK